jgi:hypothetical protein
MLNSSTKLVIILLAVFLAVCTLIFLLIFFLTSESKSSLSSSIIPPISSSSIVSSSNASASIPNNISIVAGLLNQIGFENGNNLTNTKFSMDDNVQLCVDVPRQLLYVYDFGNAVIRIVNLKTSPTALDGSNILAASSTNTYVGTPGSSGTVVPGYRTNILMNNIFGLDVNTITGNLYFRQNSTIFVVDFVTGNVSIFAGGGATNLNSLTFTTPNGGVPTVTPNPLTLDLNGSGDIRIDSGRGLLWVNVITTSPANGNVAVFDFNSNLLFVIGNGGGVNPNSNLGTGLRQRGVGASRTITIDSSGKGYLSDITSGVIQVVNLFEPNPSIGPTLVWYTKVFFTYTNGGIFNRSSTNQFYYLSFVNDNPCFNVINFDLSENTLLAGGGTNTQPVIGTAIGTYLGASPRVYVANNSFIYWGSGELGIIRVATTF